jgi:hypothetical protein
MWPKRAANVNKIKNAIPVQPSKASCILTETGGEFCKYPPSFDTVYSFVTIEDVLGYPVEYNHVCLNPRLSKEKNEMILKKAHEFHFKQIPLTDDDFDILTSFDKNHLHDFIIEYKKKLGMI